MRTPVGGVWSEAERRPLKAEFHFNRKFNRNPDHKSGGSWTRGVQPDYTISIWPAEFSKEEAEACDAMVHVHFDAKYRVEHLSNRTTARERASFHTAESYSLREEPVPYGRLKIGEKDVVSDTSRALPPAEHHVVVAWHKTPAHRTWFLRHHLAVVRLGQRRGSFRVLPELASVRHVLFRSDDNFVEPGLFRLKEVGYKVFTAEELIAKGYPGPGGDVYAVFEVEEDPAYDGQEWDGAKLQTVLKAFESRRAHRKVESLGHHSAVTRVLSLRELLKALKNPI